VRDFISLFIQSSFRLELFIIEIVYVEASIKPRKVNKPPRKVYQLFALFGVQCLTFDGVIVPFYTSQIEITP
jgi:hypothetical protein